MAVGVAVSAALKLDFEQRVLPFRDVALRALQTRVSALQRIGARCVFLHCEGRGLPSRSRCDTRRTRRLRPLGKLAIVRIRLVTVHALCENQRLLEVAVRMALRAVNASVLAFQGKLRLRVVEVPFTACSEIFFHPLVLWQVWQPCGKLPWWGSL